MGSQWCIKTHTSIGLDFVPGGIQGREIYKTYRNAKLLGTQPEQTAEQLTKKPMTQLHQTLIGNPKNPLIKHMGLSDA